MKKFILAACVMLGCAFSNQIKAQNYVNYIIDATLTTCDVSVDFITTTGTYTVSVPQGSYLEDSCLVWGIPTGVKVYDGTTWDFTMPPNSGGMYDCSFYGGNCPTSPPAPPSSVPCVEGESQMVGVTSPPVSIWGVACSPPFGWSRNIIVTLQ